MHRPAHGGGLQVHGTFAGLNSVSAENAFIVFIYVYIYYNIYIHTDISIYCNHFIQAGHMQ